MTMRNILLQIKFFVVAFLNVTYNFVPNPLRKFYLRLYGIKLGGGQALYIGTADSFI